MTAPLPHETRSMRTDFAYFVHLANAPAREGLNKLIEQIAELEGRNVAQDGI